MDFEFVVVGTPRTDQTKSSKSRADWRTKVAEAAGRAWPAGQVLLTKELSAVVIFFYREETNIDVDNIAKPIFDALAGSLIEDDRLISQVLLRKTNRDGLIVSNPSSVLANALGIAESFIYVRFGDPPIHEEIPYE